MTTKETKNFKEFLSARLDLAESTSILYTRRVQRVLDILGDLHVRSPREVNEFVEGTTKSASDHNILVAALHKYEDYLKYNEKQTTNFSDLLRSKKSANTLPKPIDVSKIEKISDSISTETLRGKRDKAIVELLYCGLRNNELCSANIGDLNDRSIEVLGKGSKERIVPLNDIAWGCVLDYVMERLEVTEVSDANFYKHQEPYKNEPLFLTSEGNRVYTREVRRIISRVSKVLGEDASKIHPHRFRHSFATHTLDQGLGNLIALKDVLGHKSLEMVNKYVLTSKTGRDLVREHHPRQKEANNACP